MGGPIGGFISDRWVSKCVILSPPYSHTSRQIRVALGFPHAVAHVRIVSKFNEY